MDLTNREPIFYAQRCKCCLNEGDLKNMWVPDNSNGESEIYGMMLTECFVLPWSQPESHKEMICNSCISRLQDALAFRREVLISEEVLREHQNEIFVCTTVKEEYDTEKEEEINSDNMEYFEIVDDTPFNEVLDDYQVLHVKEENENYIMHKNSTIPKRVQPEKRKRKQPERFSDGDQDRTSNQHTDRAFDMDVTVKEEESVMDDPGLGHLAKLICIKKEVSGPSNMLKEEPSSEQEDETEFECVEYLEIEEETCKYGSNDEYTFNETSQKPEQTSVPPPKMRKWPKKLPKDQRNRSYKQYSVRDMKLAVEAVNNDNISCNAAAEMYGVPRRTLAVKLQTLNDREYLKQMDEETKKSVDQKKHNKLVEEIRAILTYTSAILYRAAVGASRYYCAYCATEGPQFEDPDDLRAHTKTAHTDDRIDAVEHIMRPPWLNEIVKLDILNLHCTVCTVALPTWNDMFIHLEEVHNVILEEAYNRAIPYALSGELRCALCKQSFITYNNLDAHMNTHYSSYICPECGDTYLSESRLNKHKEVHNIGKYPCELCGKVFKLEKYRKKHVDFFHGRKEKVKCMYCTAKFYGLLQRHHHMLERHREMVKVITCELCGKTFDWKPYYAAHLKRRHILRKNFKCKQCDKTFLMRYELKSHEITHSTEKNYVCEICNEGYKRRVSLIRHCQTYHELEPPKPGIKIVKSVSEA